MRAFALLAVVACMPAIALAGPTRDDVATLCANAEDSSHCGRLIEARQLARLPGLAVRDGDDLRVSLYPTGSVTFRDVVRPEGVKTYALWDALSPIDAALLYVTDGERTGFLLLDRRSGRQVALPAEPVLSPDRHYLATADFCAEGCDGEVVLWRVGRDGVRRERAWRPAARWTDATVEWQTPQRLTLEYAGADGDPSQRVELRLDDARWRASP
jgi:hypothetical protein